MKGPRRSAMAWFLVVLAGFVSGLNAVVRSQTPTLEQPKATGPVPRLERLKDWLAAVDRHEPGTADEPAIVVSAWSSNQLRVVLIDARALVALMRNMTLNTFTVKTPDGRAPVVVRYSGPELKQLRDLARAAARRGDENRVLKRGALLHSDIAMLVPADGEPLSTIPPSGPQHFVMRTSDGRQLSLEQAASHWDIARVLLDGVTPNPSRDEMVRLWYRATLAHMHKVQQFEILHHEHALQLFSTDAEILFRNGCLHETFASPLVQNAIRSAVLPSGVTFDVASEHAELRRAESFLRLAVEHAPGLIEARLHLGRVFGLQGRHADAAGELRKVVAVAQEPLLVYYAALFLGAEEEALGRREQARASYEHAAALAPRAQSPHLALSQLARRHGDRTAALNAIQQVFALSGDEATREDPWWRYRVTTGRDADALLDEVRKPFLSATKVP